MIFKKLYKYRLLIVLALIAGIMGAIKWEYRNVKWEEVSQVITPTVTPTSAPQINTDYPLWELIPHSGNGFVVDQYAEPLALSVKIEKNVDIKAVTQEIYAWMLENKVATESHKLIFKKTP